MGIGIIGAPTAQEDRILKATNLDHIVLPFNVSDLHLEFRVEGHDVFRQHQRCCLTHLVPRVIGDNHLEAFFPHLASPGLFHVLCRLLQVKSIHGNILVVREALHIRIGRHDHQVIEDVLLVCLPVKCVLEGLPRVDVRKEVGWNAIAVELTTADIRIAGGIDFPAEHPCRKGQLWDLVKSQALHGFHLRHVRGVDHDPVRVTALEHELSGAPFFHVLDDGGLDFGLRPPVVFKPLEDELFGRFPEFHSERPCAIFDFLQRLMTRRRIVVLRGILDLAVPGAPGNSPLFVQNGRGRVAQYAH